MARQKISTPKRLQIPDKLSQGDLVDIVAPSFVFDRKTFEAGVGFITNELKLKPRFRKDIFSKELFYAGSQNRRLQELFDALTNPDSKAVLIARGGYGAAQILEPLLEKLKRIKKLKPKIVLGYSDSTLIINSLYRELGWQTFHGPMVCGRPFQNPNELELSSLKRCLFEKKPIGKIQTSQMQVLAQGKARGALVGGCLTLVVSSIGTRYEIDTRGKILFLEEVDERPYRVGRILLHLIHAGMLDQAKAIVFGEMIRCNPPAPAQNGIAHPTEGISVEEVIYDTLQAFLKKRKIPVLYRFPAGHGDQQLAFPIGATVEVDAEKKGSVVFK